MKNICILGGEEEYLKDREIFKLCSRHKGALQKVFYINDLKKGNIRQEIKHIESFFSTFDLFGNFKVAKVIMFEPQEVQFLLDNIEGLSEDNLLIIDIKGSDYTLKDVVFTYRGEVVPVKIYREFRDYEKDKVFNFMKENFIYEGIMFESKEDEEHALEYLFNVSQNSYSFIYKEIKKLKLLGQSKVSFDDVLNLTTVFSNKNFYRACNKIFESKNNEELVDVLDNYLPEVNAKTLSAFINIFTSKINDYILLSKGMFCKQKSNYFMFRNTKINIKKPEKFIIELNKLGLSMKKEKNILKEELIWCMIEHMEVMDCVS